LATFILKIPKPLSNKLLRDTYSANIWTGKYENSPKEVPERDPTLIHKIICTKCSHPIIGCRFICSTCEDYNICESCEVNSTHPHCFLKIRYALPDNTKINIKFVFEELETEKSDRNSLLSSRTSLRKPKITDNEKKKEQVAATIRSVEMGDIDRVHEIETESFFYSI